MDLGQSWAYRARSVDGLVEVVVVRFGSRTPARVLVRFVAEEFEGREEWVPPARLKVPWSQVEVLRERESRWAAVRAVSVLSERDPEYWAVGLVLDTLIPEDLVEYGSRCDQGVARVHDVDALAARLNLEPQALSVAPESFVEDGDLVVPLAMTRLIVRRALELSPSPVLAKIARSEREFRHKMIYGEEFREGRDQYRHIDAGFFVDYVEEAPNRPMWELVRGWAGAAAVDRFDELAALRVEVARLGRLAERAIEALQRAGQSRLAQELSAELGVRADDALDAASRP